MVKVFIDGQSGTTGLMIRQRLASRSDIELLLPAEAARKDLSHRLDLLRLADISILCLPDASARELAALAPADSRIIDASSVFRVHPEWVYGLPEMSQEQPERIAEAHRVSNPGCYPIGAILMLRPLVEKGLLPPDTGLNVIAQSGYSGGGKSLIQAYETEGARQDYPCARPYALNNQHKHLPEMQRYAGLASLLFMPCVGAYKQGLLVQIPLPNHWLDCDSALASQAILDCWQKYYQKAPLVEIATAPAQWLDNGYLDPSALAGSDGVELTLFGDESNSLLTARYDNLGKGAAGSAVQNLNLMLGKPSLTGLMNHSGLAYQDRC